MNRPILHVMIPAFGESPFLRQTLESAIKYLPADVPVTVIEDPSMEVNLESLVNEFPRVQYVKNIDWELNVEVAIVQNVESLNLEKEN